MVYNGNFLQVRSDKVFLENGCVATREFIEHPGAVCIIAFDEDENLIIVKQYRYPMSQVTYELPAGKIDHDELAIDCAYREFEEETGYKAKKMEYIGQLFMAPAYSTEIIHLYVASQLEKSAQRLDDQEFLIVEKVKLDAALKMIFEDKIPDVKTQVAIFRYMFLNKKAISYLE